MAKNILNEFSLIKEGDKVFAQRLLKDEYDIPGAINLVDSTFKYYEQLKMYIEHFDNMLSTAIAEQKRKGVVDKKRLDKFKEQWHNQLKIYSNIELPKMERELPQYIELAKTLNCEIPEYITQDNELEKEE